MFELRWVMYGDNQNELQYRTMQIKVSSCFANETVGTGDWTKWEKVPYAHILDVKKEK